MLLPLLEKAKEQSAYFLLTPKTGSRSSGAPQCGTPFPEVAAIPQRAVLHGEQYRFHFDMTKCIGCKCCVVACNEQNGNPAEINWRRVGEIEGGWYPDTHRSHLSMGCNHCLEPTCLEGCPVDAYSKDPITGVVIHNAETCIGFSNLSAMRNRARKKATESLRCQTENLKRAGNREVSMNLFESK